MTAGAGGRVDVVVVGAGVAGLACARDLAAAGRRVVVLDKARGVGGRCATRRVDGRPVDHGVAFLHGRDLDLLAAIDATRAATPLSGWPNARIGGGLPCQPEAFEGLDRRIAFAEGLTRFPKSLADGLEVRLGAAVRGLGEGGAGEIVLILADGSTLAAPQVVLTPPLPQARALLAGWPDAPAAVRALDPLLAQVRYLPCLTVMAVYPDGTPRPRWELSLPSDSAILHTVAHDSAKRPAGAPVTLVLQAGPGFSTTHLDADPQEWARELVREAGDQYGPWAAAPVRVEPHRWRFARVSPPSGLSATLTLPLPGGATLALAGDGFAPAGGVQGAWRAGRSVAASLAGVAASKPGTA